MIQGLLASIHSGVRMVCLLQTIERGCRAILPMKGSYTTHRATKGFLVAQDILTNNPMSLQIAYRGVLWITHFWACVDCSRGVLLCGVTRGDTAALATARNSLSSRRSCHKTKRQANHAPLRFSNLFLKQRRQNPPHLTPSRTAVLKTATEMEADLGARKVPTHLEREGVRREVH